MEDTDEVRQAKVLDVWKVRKALCSALDLDPYRVMEVTVGLSSDYPIIDVKYFVDTDIAIRVIDVIKKYRLSEIEP